MARSFVFACIAFFLFGTACQNTPYASSSPGATPLHYSTLKIDSFRVYPCGKGMSYYNRGFRFSTLEPNRIWVTPNNEEAFELDLENGGKTLFSKKFGPELARIPLSASNLLPDTFAPSVCWMLFKPNHGLYRYDKATGRGTLFQVDALCLLFTETDVWIGAADGLWRYERSSGRCRVVDQSPAFRIGQLSIREGRILLGDLYAYDPKSACWQELNKGYADIPMKRETACGASCFPNLPICEDWFARTSTPAEQWYCSRHYWFCGGSGGAPPELFYPSVALRPRSMAADEDNLYLLTPDTFLIVNKNFLRRQFRADPAIWARWDRLKKLTDSLQLNGMDNWSNRQAKMAFLRQEFPDERDPFIAERLYRFARMFQVSDAGELQALLKQENVEPEVIDAAFFQVIYSDCRAGKWNEALRLCREFKSLRPNAPDGSSRHIQNNCLTILDTTLHKLDSLQRAPVSDDERLWHAAHLVLGVCQNSGLFDGEACIHVELADSVFRRIIRLYPDSPRADDAAYESTSISFCYEGEDGSDHPEAVKLWDKFLLKYPDSEWRPQALCAKAWALSRSEADARKGMTLIAEAEQLRPDLFAAGGELLSVKQEFQRWCDGYNLEFDAVLSKGRIRPGDPVELVFTVRNKGNTTQTLQLGAKPEYPAFCVDITPEDAFVNCIKPLKFVEFNGRTLEGPARSFSLKPGKTYRETWDITKMAAQNRNATPGYFVFDQPGVYNIRCYYFQTADTKQTETLRLQVE